MAVAAPGPKSRWRCSACGNLTRFDVVKTTRSRDYFHAALSGEMVVEEHEVLQEVIESVTCRWCNRPGTVEISDKPYVPEDTDTTS
jgi:hypothetical protein